MSAFFSVCYDDRIELLTDGAQYQDDGTLIAVCEKVYRSSRLPLAVTARGTLDFDVLRSFFDTLSSLSATVGDFIDQLQAQLDRRRDLGSPDAFEVLIVAFVDDKPINLYFSTHPIIDSVDPWAVYAMGPEFGGGPSFTLDELRGEGVSVESLSAGLEECGADLMELMRKRKAGNPSNSLLPDVYGIGGHVDLTVVRPEGVTTKRLRTWPDVIGEKIDPFKEDAAAA